MCGGVLRFKNDAPDQPGSRKFRTPFIGSRWAFPAMSLVAVALCFVLNADGVRGFFSTADLASKVPLGVFLLCMVALNAACFVKNLSLIPVMGLACCGYLMTELGITNWLRFGIWLVVGLVIYFFYGVKHSRLRASSA